MGNTVTAKGRNGQINFDGKTVTITREGATARMTHGRGEKSIPLRQIAAVQFKPVSLMTSGFIQFTVPGEISSRTAKGGRTLDAVKDENAIVFLKKDQADFERLRDAIRGAISELT